MPRTALLFILATISACGCADDEFLLRVPPGDCPEEEPPIDEEPMADPAALGAPGRPCLGSYDVGEHHLARTGRNDKNGICCTGCLTAAFECHSIRCDDELSSCGEVDACGHGGEECKVCNDGDPATVDVCSSVGCLPF